MIFTISTGVGFLPSTVPLQNNISGISWPEICFEVYGDLGGCFAKAETLIHPRRCGKRRFEKTNLFLYM